MSRTEKRHPLHRKIGDGTRAGDRLIRHCTCPDCTVSAAKMRGLHRSARRRFNRLTEEITDD